MHTNNFSSTNPTLKTDSSPKNIQYPSDLLQAAFERFKVRVFSENIFPNKFHSNRAGFEPNPDEPRTYITKIAIEEQESDCAQISKKKLMQSILLLMIPQSESKLRSLMMRCLRLIV